MNFVSNQNYNLFLWKDQWFKRPYYCIYYLLFTFTRNKITELSSRRKTEEKEEEETPDRKLSGVGMKKQRKEENTKLKNNGKKTKYRTKRRSRNGETMKRKKNTKLKSNEEKTKHRTKRPTSKQSPNESPSGKQEAEKHGHRAAGKKALKGGQQKNMRGRLDFENRTDMLWVLEC